MRTSIREYMGEGLGVPNQRGKKKHAKRSRIEWAEVGKGSIVATVADN